MKILLIEDNEQVGLLVHELLAEGGNTVDWARSSAEASALLRLDGHDEYDWLVSDYELGDGNGIEVIDRYAGRAQTLLWSGLDVRSRVERDSRRRRPDHVLVKSDLGAGIALVLGSRP